MSKILGGAPNHFPNIGLAAPFTESKQIHRALVCLKEAALQKDLNGVGADVTEHDLHPERPKV